MIQRLVRRLAGTSTSTNDNSNANNSTSSTSSTSSSSSSSLSILDFPGPNGNNNSTEAVLAPFPKLITSMKFQGLFDSAIFAYGSNKRMQLGLPNTVKTVTEPCRLEEMHQKPVKQIACGKNHILMLAANGTVYAVGDNSVGACGLGYIAFADHPRLVLHNRRLLTNVIKIASGASHSLFLTSEGKVLVCGLSARGNIGFGDGTHAESEKYCYSPIECPVTAGYNTNIWSSFVPNANGSTSTDAEPKNIIDIACGKDYSIVVAEDMSAYVLGTIGGSASSKMWMPITTTEETFTSRKYLPSIRKIDCSQTHVVILRSDSSIFMMGSNRFGQAGSNVGSHIAQFQKVSINEQICKQYQTPYDEFRVRVVDVAAVSDGTFFLTSNHRIWYAGIINHLPIAAQAAGTKLREVPLHQLFNNSAAENVLVDRVYATQFGVLDTQTVFFVTKDNYIYDLTKQKPVARAAALNKISISREWDIDGIHAGLDHVAILYRRPFTSYQRMTDIRSRKKFTDVVFIQ